MKNVKERFLKLISYDTQSDHESDTYPTTKKQLDFAQVVAEECRTAGLSNLEVSEYGYVTAELPANNGGNGPVIGFIAHMDTSPDCSGANVKGVCISEYDGKDIQLNPSRVLSPEEFPHLKNYIGNELIVTNGETLLGADDKAGVAEIITAMEYLAHNPEIKHGTIKVCFTPDEEVGKGADKFDVDKFAADFAYTIDGGELGELEYESFNAAGARITITGKSVHPGTAKGVMKNAAQIAAEMAQTFPPDETPATTEERQGFYHLTGISGNVERARLDYIIRDFDKTQFNARKDFVIDTVTKINQKYGEVAVLNLVDQYFNMRDVLEDKQYIINIAKKAMEDVGVPVKINAIRGGTDGSRLSFMGLPCPNIFTGGHNFHGPYEYIPVESMVNACKVIVRIAELGGSFEG